MSRQQVRQQVYQAEANLREQKDLVAQRRKEADASERVLLAQEKRLAPMSQRNLRFGGFAGLQGKKQKVMTTKAKESIEKGKRDIGLFRKELVKFEKEQLNPFEERIKEVKRFWGI